MWTTKPQITRKKRYSGKSNNSKLNLGCFSQDAIDLEVAHVVNVHTAMLAYTSARVRDTHSESCLTYVHAILERVLLKIVGEVTKNNIKMLKISSAKNFGCPSLSQKNS